MRPLGDFSTEALLRELARRNDGEPHLKPVTRWCENCTHWRNSTSDRDTANNCRQDHVMEFRMPEHPYSEDYGFFRRGCRDWARRVEQRPTPPSTTVPTTVKLPPRGSRPGRAT
jgi:hypothetical protein